MIGKKLMIVGMLLLTMSTIAMRFKIGSDFVIGLLYGISIGILLLSIKGV